MNNKYYEDNYILGEFEDYDTDNPEHSNPNKYVLYKGNVFQHVVSALKKNDIADEVVNLAILFHDIGKIKTYNKDENGKISYLRHAKVGIDMVKEIAERLKLDNKTKQSLMFAVEHHMKIHNLLSMSNNKVYKLIKDNNWKVLFNVAKCDAQSRKHMFNQSEWDATVQKIEKITNKYQNKDVQDQLKKIVNGKWIMQLLNIEQGRKVGEVIRSTIEWIVDNDIPIDDTNKIKNYILNFDT